jgi:hypothetical protein
MVNLLYGYMVNFLYSCLQAYNPQPYNHITHNHITTQSIPL